MDLFPDANMINTIHLRSDNNCETYSCKMHYACTYSACTGVWTDDGDNDKNDEGDDDDDDDDDLDDGDDDDDDDKNDDDDDDDNDDDDDDGDDDDTMLINQIARPLASTSGHFCHTMQDTSRIASSLSYHPHLTSSCQRHPPNHSRLATSHCCKERSF